MQPSRHTQASNYCALSGGSTHIQTHKAVPTPDIQSLHTWGKGIKIMHTFWCDFKRPPVLGRK
jgi:hypothetical protein